jgi:lysophospholipase L1-like esterase
MALALFNAADGTNIAGYSEDGLTFTVLIGGATITPTGRVISSVSGTLVHANNLTVANGTASGDFIVRGATLDHGVVFRWSGAGYYLARFNSGKLQLFKAAPSFALISETTYALTIGTTYRLEIVFSGSSIICSVNGVEAINVTDTTLTTGTSGFRIGIGSTSAGAQLSRFETFADVALGTITQNALSENNVSLTSTAISPVSATLQWYRSVSLPLTPSPANLLSGQTALTLTDTTATPGVLYFYKLVATLNSYTVASAPIAGYRLPILKLGFIGDSITAGYGTVTNALAELSKLKYLKKITSQNSAIAGSRSDQWVANSTNLNNALTAFNTAFGTPSESNPVYVSIMLGVNDSRVTRPTVNQWKTNMTSLLTTLTNAGYKVILHTPPYVSIPQSAAGEADNGYDTEAGMALLLGYSAAAKELVDNSTVYQGAENITEYFAVNVSEFLTTDIGTNDIPTLVHPNTNGAISYGQLWANGIYKAVLADKIGGGNWGSFGSILL